MKKIAFLLFLPLWAFSQQKHDKIPLDQNNSANVEVAEWRNYDGAYSGVRGTPFLYETLMPGKLMLADSTEADSVFLNYNLQENYLAFKKGEAGTFITVSIDKASAVETFLDNGETQQLVKLSSIQFEDKVDEDYLYIILMPKNQQLIKKVEKRFVEADYKGALSTGETYDEFRENVHYYLKNKEGKYEKMKLNSGSAFKVLDSKKDKKVAKQYLKDNNFLVDDEASAIQYIRFLLDED